MRLVNTICSLPQPVCVSLQCFTRLLLDCFVGSNLLHVCFTIPAFNSFLDTEVIPFIAVSWMKRAKPFAGITFSAPFNTLRILFSSSTSHLSRYYSISCSQKSTSSLPSNEGAALIRLCISRQWRDFFSSNLSSQRVSSLSYAFDSLSTNTDTSWLSTSEELL